MTKRDLWGGFVWDAEDFFVSYLESSRCHMLKSHLFLIGHSIELFLKAIYIDQTGDVDKAIKFKHNIRSLFEKCQTGNSPFMSDFKFKGTFEELSKLSDKANENLKRKEIMIKGFTQDEVEKFVHFTDHAEFYLISENLMNLKYWHTPWLSKSSSYKIAVTGRPIFRPNPYWIDFVKEAENYLGFTSADIKAHFERYGDDLHENTKAWLSKLYT